MLPTPYSVANMFKRSPSTNIYYNTKPSFMYVTLEPTLIQHHYVSNLDTYFMSLMGDTSRLPCDGSLPVGIRSLPRNMTSKLFLHYLGACIHQWKVSSLSATGFIIGLLPIYFIWCLNSNISFTPYGLYCCTLITINIINGFSRIFQRLTSLVSN